MNAFFILRPISTLVGERQGEVSQKVPAEIQDFQGVILAQTVGQEESSLIGQLVPV